MGPEDEPSVGLYHSGIQHLSIGTATLEEYSDEKWEYELRMTIAHELIHFLQDIEGSIGKGNYEDQAESKAEEFVKSMGYVDPDAWTKEGRELFDLKPVKTWLCKRKAIDDSQSASRGHFRAEG